LLADGLAVDQESVNRSNRNIWSVNDFLSLAAPLPPPVDSQVDYSYGSVGICTAPKVFLAGCLALGGPPRF
jgi:hypothetical protein